MHPVRGATTGELKLYAEKANFSARQFEIITDIAAEAWGTAANRWQELNECPLDFEAIAKQPNDYRAQKSRNLYRPTY